MPSHLEPRTLIELELEVLDPAERTGAAHHLETCDACFQRQQAIRAELEGIAEGVAGEPAPASSRPLPFIRRGLPAGPALLVAAATLAVGIGLGRWLAAPDVGRPGRSVTRPALVAGVPVRLLGHRDAGAQPLIVTARAGEPIVLFIKIAAPIDAAAEYDLVLSPAGGPEERKRISGSVFDGAGTTAVLVPAGLALAGTVAVRVEPVPTPGAGSPSPIFQDQVAIRPAAP